MLRKNSLLVIYKIPRFFFNTFTVYGKHYLLKRDNLTQPIQIQFDQKQKTFSDFFFAFLKSMSNFKYLPKKDYRHSSCISLNSGSEKYGYINVWKVVFHTTLRQTTRQMGRNSSCNLNESTFKIFINQCEGSCIGRSLS